MTKTIFITGASSGIGKATAKFFQEKDWNVIATMRNPEKETELNQLENVTLLPLDVTNFEQIQSAVKEATSKNTIDVVLNNAGYGTVGALEGTTDQEIQQVINTNLLGVIRLTKEFIPHFRENKGVFITVSSIGGLVAYPFFSLYHATKWAIEGWTESLAFELNQLGIQVKTVQPGPTKTDFVGRSLVVPEHPAYDEFFDKFKKMFFSDDVINGLEPPETVSEVIYEAATDGKNQLRYMVGAAANGEYKRRLELGAEIFHQEYDTVFLINKLPL
ncbi:NAD(P)-dependent dehydrogenase (short-subunit alcohol dehydrogenase family) [Chryseobacterium sp. SORGH_AS 447]|uniref:SDR family oxidoreductase n=1 Tax=Chryseobacterium sp. SORGH_AS_0447 TaxID=3041769 RepID=UPI00278B8E58|nr:SDR family oxidoreductase [Chryseobacterium sp. SORGH_AS_0447]MDQ1162571.1 NAD(P)-dependent dehydrogenase (short-subunit alcohol dehydrogenase family) [Chryseobacterium sp. SORGH_AS_0447]